MSQNRSGAIDENLLVFAHIGDLHLTNVPATAPRIVREQQATLRRDLAAIVDEIGSADRNCIDFVYIPGDIADNGCASEYATLQDHLLKNAAGHPIDAPRFALHLIPGDHDRQLGNMDGFKAFHASLETIYALPPPGPSRLSPLPSTCTPPEFTPDEADANGYPCDPPDAGTDIVQFYYSRTIRGVRCIFLDLVSAGFGRKGRGLDFRIGTQQMSWLLDEIKVAKKAELPVAVFMHCYPVDMADNDEKAALAGLFWNAGVTLVEMGHTHYNELAPDGRTAYAAARSVGQNEDGPVGYAIGAIHQTPEHGIVTSWRFKQRQFGWPFVMITSPADRRMATEPLRPSNTKTKRHEEVKPSADDKVHVRALVLTDQKDCNLIYCYCQVDGGSWEPMGADATHPGLYHLEVSWPPGSRTVSVRATDGRGYDKDFYDTDTIEPVAIDYKAKSRPMKPGSDDQTVGSWFEKGVRGDQAGPNRGRHKW